MNDEPEVEMARERGSLGTPELREVANKKLTLQAVRWLFKNSYCISAHSNPMTFAGNRRPQSEMFTSVQCWPNKDDPWTADRVYLSTCPDSIMGQSTITVDLDQFVGSDYPFKSDHLVGKSSDGSIWRFHFWNSVPLLPPDDLCNITFNP